MTLMDNYCFFSDENFLIIIMTTTTIQISVHQYSDNIFSKMDNFWFSIILYEKNVGQTTKKIALKIYSYVNT